MTCPVHGAELVPDPFVIPGTAWAGRYLACPGVFPVEGAPWCDHLALEESDRLRHTDPWLNPVA